VEDQGSANLLKGWLISPTFDLLFVANWGWVLLLIPGMASETGTVVDFWQVYFITLPHRWITLILVILDRDRRAGQERKLFLVAFIAIGVIAGVSWFTGGLTCLALVDFAWNAWHFGSQHAGVARMYGLKAKAERSNIERWTIRLFVTYTLLRTAAWAVGWTVDQPTYELGLQIADFGMIGLVAFCLGKVLSAPGLSVGRLAYLTSVFGLYAALLIALMTEASPFVVPLTVATSLFHAAEYLAIISIYAKKRTQVGSPGFFRTLSAQWPAFLGLYVVALGTLGILLEAGSLSVFWGGINLGMAFIHYAFDGLIWKLRVSSTAQALGATS
jgi:hypothetical protein